MSDGAWPAEAKTAFFAAMHQTVGQNETASAAADLLTALVVS